MGKRQKSKGNFKSQFQKTISKNKRQGKPNYYALLQQSETLYRFFSMIYVLKKPSQFPNIHLTKKPRTSYVTISKNQCNPWQKNLAACLPKAKLKRQFQKSKGRDNLTTMLYSSSVKKVYFF